MIEDGHALVAVTHSLISSGTEIATIHEVAIHCLKTRSKIRKDKKISGVS